MKKTILILVVFVVSQNIQSQNWQIINPDYVHFYNETFDTIITNTVKTDSVDNINGNPIYYLNQVIAPCDTCSFEAFHRHMPNFLQKKVEVFDDGRYWFRDTASYVLKTGETGDSWVFDTAQNVTAQIMSKTEEEVLENIFDSVLLIELSNTAQIKISKSYGIIQFPVMDGYYPPISLVGIKTDTAEYGEKVPDFWDVFDYNVGDVFQYTWNTGNGGYPPPNWEVTTIKRRILSKEIDADTLQYEVHVIEKRLVEGTVEEYETTLEYVNCPQNIANQYPNILYDMCSDPFYISEFCDDDEYLYGYIDFRIFELSDSIGLGNSNSEQCILIPNAYNNDLLEFSDMYYLVRIAIPSLGYVVEGNSFFEINNHKELEGYVVNGDTSGIITPDGVLLRSIENKIKDKPVVFPNPVKRNELLNIRIPRHISGEKIQLDLISIEGNSILTRIIEADNFKLQASAQPGLYIIRIITINSHTSLNCKLLVN
ncbi:MAG: hypothetical protein K9G58_03190 [Bacteroidales bacterium]|nr:hypothetical protein [Bacteroidales bacterium]MCF8386436.1 hypothetical protein [Bacteroidales bacterium]MCF8397146.1 hypothetical protein [Bacteroidales bacterium]